MAAPALTARIIPPDPKLEDGFKTIIAFAADPDVSLWEKAVKPPGVDGGDAIPQSTMHNIGWRTKSARHLKDLTDCTMTVGYNVKAYDQVIALVNVEGSISVHYPDGSAECFYGFLKSFEPGELKEGEPPEGTATIVCTNWDPVNNVEQGPAYHPPAGT
jgi:hypothetical protein